MNSPTHLKWNLFKTRIMGYLVTDRATIQLYVDINPLPFYVRYDFILLIIVSFNLVDKSVLNGFLNGLSEAIVKDKTVLNSFDDGGFLTVSAAKKGAKRVYIRKSPSSDNVVAVARYVYSLHT